MGMFLTYPGGSSVGGETTPESTEQSVNFNTLFKNQLFVKVDAIKAQMETAFQEEATKINDFNFDFEKQTIEQLLGAYQNYVDDLADNYLLAMYEKIYDPEDGIAKLVEAACPSIFEDPLSNADCIMQTKEEIALNNATEVLEAIAQEYQRNIKRLGTKFTIDSGLLAKDIELRKKALSFKGMPKLTVQDPDWIKKFDTVKQGNFWDDLGNVIISSAKNVGSKLLNDFKKDVTTFAGQAISDVTQTARDQIKAKTDKYVKDLKAVQDTAIKKLNNAIALIETKLQNTSKIISQSGTSFMNYIQSNLTGFVSEKIIKPTESIIQIIQEKANSLAETATFLDSVATSTKKNIQASLAGIVSTLDESLSLLVSDDPENPGALDKLENLLVSPLDSVQKSLQSSNTQIISLADTLPAQTKKVVQADIDDLSTSLSKVVDDINEDMSALSGQFISPLKNAVVQVQGSLQTVSQIDPFGDLSQEVKSALKDQIKIVTDKINTIINSLTDQFDTLKNQASQIIKDSAQATTIATNTKDTLTGLTDTVLPQFKKYVSDKLSIITKTLENISWNIDNIDSVASNLISDFLSTDLTNIKGPLKTLDVLKDEILCQEVPRKGSCKTTASQVIANITKQLNPQSIVAEFNAYLKKITDGLDAAFRSFKTDLLAFLQKQQTSIVTTFNQNLSTTQVTGNNLKQALADLPNQLTQLIDTIKKDALAQANNVIDELNAIKDNISSIRDAFAQTPTFDQAVKSYLDHKDEFLTIASAIPDKMNKIISTLQQEGQEALINKLTVIQTDIQSYNDTLVKALETSLTTEDLLSEITGEIGGVNSLINQISDAAQSRVNTIAQKITTLKDDTENLIVLTDGLQETLKNQVFDSVNNIVSKLDPDTLHLATDVQSVLDNSSIIKDAINKSAAKLKTQASSIQQSGQNLVATFASADSAEQMLIELQEQLPQNISGSIEIIPDGNTLVIQPNIISVTSEEFSVLFDDMKEVLTGIGADKQGDFISALKMFG